MSVRITETWGNGEREVIETGQTKFLFKRDKTIATDLVPSEIRTEASFGMLRQPVDLAVAGYGGSLTLEWFDDASVFPVKFLQTPNPETLIDIADAVFTTRNRLPPSYFDKYPWRDSREVVELIKTWAEEFERLHSETNWNEDEDADYIISVDRFAEAKIKELLS